MVSDLVSLRRDASSSSALEVSFRDPLFPVNCSLQFNEVFVNSAASQYVCLKNECSQICLSHIVSVSRKRVKGAYILYTLTCADHMSDGIPAQIPVRIKIYEKTT